MHACLLAMKHQYLRFSIPILYISCSFQTIGSSATPLKTSWTQSFIKDPSCSNGHIDLKIMESLNCPHTLTHTHLSPLPVGSTGRWTSLPGARCAWKPWHVQCVWCKVPTPACPVSPTATALTPATGSWTCRWGDKHSSCHLRTPPRNPNPRSASSPSGDTSYALLQYLACVSQNLFVGNGQLHCNYNFDKRTSEPNLGQSDLKIQPMILAN